MSISLLQSKSLEAGTVSSTTLVFTSSVTAGSLKTCLLRIGSSTVTATVSDDKDGAYTQDLITVNSSGATLTSYIFSRANATAGTTTITVTLSGAANLRMAIQEVAGIVTSSPLTGTPAGSTGLSTVLSSGSTTTTAANAFLCGFFTGSNAVAFGIVPDAPWTQDQQLLSNADRLTSAYRIVSATGTYSATATLGGSDGWTAQIAAYQGAGGGGAQNQEVEAPNRPRPGRGPFSKNQFRVSDTTAYTSTNSALSGLAAIVFGSSGILIGLTPEVEPPNRPRPGRGPFSKGRFYVSDTTAYTSSSSSALAGTATLTFGETGALLGAGALAATATLTFGSSATLNGAGGLAGTSALNFSATGTAALAGAMAGTSTLSFGTTGLLAGAGALTATSALTFASTAVLQGSGVLAGTSALLIGASGTLSAAGGGTASLIIDASGALSATGTLAGLAALLMSASGTLIDANAAPIPAGGSNPGAGGGGGGRHPHEREWHQTLEEEWKRIKKDVPPEQKKTPAYKAVQKAFARQAPSAELSQKLAALLQDDDDEAIQLLGETADMKPFIERLSALLEKFRA